MSTSNVTNLNPDVNTHTSEDSQPSSGPTVATTRRANDCTVAQAKATASNLTRIALAAAGLSHRAAADGAGVSRNLADWWCDVDHPRTIPLGRLLTLASTSRRGREAASAILTGALSHVAAVAPSLTVARDLRGLVDDLHVEVGELASEWRGAIADGEISTKEQAGLCREIADVERVLATLRHELAKAVKA